MPWRHSTASGCLAVLAVCFVLILTTCCQACPSCRDALATGANHANVIRGYFWSICFMMSMPFLILGGLGTYFYLQIIKARAAQAAALPDLALTGGAMSATPNPGERREPRLLGVAKGEFTIPDSFLGPLSDEILDSFEGRP